MKYGVIRVLSLLFLTTAFSLSFTTAATATDQAVLFSLNSVQEKCADFSGSLYSSYYIPGLMSSHTVSGGTPVQVATCDTTSAKLLGTCNVSSGQGGIYYFYESQAYRHVAVAEQECISKSVAVWTAGVNYPGIWWPLNCQNDTIAMEGTTCSTWSGSSFRTNSAGDCNGSVTNPSGSGYYIVPSCPSTVAGVGDMKGTCTRNSGLTNEQSTTYYKQEVCRYHGQCDAQSPPGACDLIGGIWNLNTVTPEVYTVSATPGNNGSLDASTPSPASVNQGGVTSFKFNANTGYFVYLATGCNGAQYFNINNQSVATYIYSTGTISSACSVSAAFAPKSFSVSASVGANGYLDSTTPSPATAAYGTTTTFKFNANPDFHISSISGCNGITHTDNSNSETSYTYATGIISDNCTVNATFASNVTVTVNGICGTSAGQAQSAAPTTNLCSVGTASSVTGANPWSWSCAGLNGGTAVNCSTVSTISIPLTQGWNLISLPLQPSPTTVNTFLDNNITGGSYINLWGRDNSANWLTYPQLTAYTAMTDVTTGSGYWLNMSAAGTLQVEGTTANRNITLGAGWNMVGYSSVISQGVSDAVENIAGSIDCIWARSNGQWLSYDPTRPINSLTTLEPGMGYWIKIMDGGAATWDLP